MIALKASQISYAFPSKVLFEDFSIEIKQGEFIVLIGNNGTGKTSLLKLLAQVECPQSGTVTLYDSQGNVLKDAYKRVYVGQNEFNLHNAFCGNALEIVLSAYTPALGLFKRPSEDQINTAKEYLFMMGLKDYLYTPLSRLSGGQRQRVFIAKALVNDPEFLFLDEPTSALDASFSSELLSLLKHLQAQHHLTIVMVTHDLQLAKEIGERVYCVGDQDVMLLSDEDMAEELAHAHRHESGIELKHV